MNKLEINKKGSRVCNKGKEMSNQLSSLEIASYPLYRHQWLLFVSVDENTISTE